MKTSRTKKIAILGGSFNPPTLAHLRLMLGALDAIHGDIGLFVPSSQDYVARKMKKSGRKNEVIAEQSRLQMLSLMSKEDPRLRTDSLEFGRDGKGRTFETMEAIQEKYPSAELWFILGGDKLAVFPRWHRVEEFLQRFHILVVTRDGAMPENDWQENPLLRQYRHRFQVMIQPEGTEGISSSRVRELLRSGDKSAAGYVHPGVWEMLLAEGWLKWEITSFRGEYGFLSNFYEAPIRLGGMCFGSGEAAFQGQKCRTEEERSIFQNLRPSEAKKAGRRVELRPDWEQVKVGLMEEIVRAKFTQNPELGQMLLATGNRPIIEGNTWNDTCWGVDIRTGQGENHLGKILMKVREELREEE